MRNNHSFLNRVSFRRRAPTRSTPTTSQKTANPNIKSTPVAAVRSCIDTLSETASITPPASLFLPHEGSSSGKSFLFTYLNEEKYTPIFK